MVSKWAAWGLKGEGRVHKRILIVIAVSAFLPLLTNAAASAAPVPSAVEAGKTVPKVKFTKGAPIRVGEWACSAAIGDFDRDGKADIAVANAYPGVDSVSILDGNGKGQFKRVKDYGVGDSPGQVVTADFNADGYRDLATANSMSDSVTILYGQKGGKFANARSFQTDGWPNTMTLGDFNRDGAPDIATGNYLGHSVTVMLGDGSGGFKSIKSIKRGGSCEVIASGDFNGDRNPDLAIASPDDDIVRILQGDGKGGFEDIKSSYKVDSVPRFIAVSDFNRDGKSDLAIACWRAHTISILLGQGDGRFGDFNSYIVAGEPFCVAVGDFNHDKIPDLVSADWEMDGSATVLRGVGNGTFVSGTILRAQDVTQGVAAGDLNGDGWDDVVACNHGSASVSIFLNRR